ETTNKQPTAVMAKVKSLEVLPALLLLPALAASFGNEYVHIKVHVPRDKAPSIAIDAEPPEPHKVIHHFHHHAPPHQRSRARAPPKPKTSPLLESVILSDLDKPLHMSEHADYLNHAKELAEHLSEAYVIKKPPTPPPSSKKKVNTYTIIEENHQPHSYSDDYESRPEHSVDTYRVIESRPQHYRVKHQHHHDDDDDDDDVGYHYAPPSRHYRQKGSSSVSYHAGAFAEPAPVEEPLDLDQGYSYSPPFFNSLKSARPPANKLEAPEESPLDGEYHYDYTSSSGSSSSSSSSFQPSPQLHSQSASYDDEVDAFAGPVPTYNRRPLGPVDWSSRTGFNSAVAKTYKGLDSYNVGHVQDIGSGGYQYPGPYL
ncbi:hypothetical protein KR222_010592, partial [Zaprionus bogoriensis]